MEEPRQGRRADDNTVSVLAYMGLTEYSDISVGFMLLAELWLSRSLLLSWCQR